MAASKKQARLNLAAERAALKNVAYTNLLDAQRQARNNYLASQRSAKTASGIDYSKSLRNLGWIPGKGKAPGKWESGGTWEDSDLGRTQGINTTSGKAISDLARDFAYRGMGHSSGYIEAQNALVNQLNSMREDQALAQARFGAGQATALREFDAQQRAAQNKALATARTAELKRLLGR